MSKFIEIGGLIKKGLGQKVVKKFSENSDVISVGYANEEPQICLTYNNLVTLVKQIFLLSLSKKEKEMLFLMSFTSI